MFPEAFVPVARHPLVLERDGGLQRAIRSRQLYRYMHFTAKLEHLVVNRTVLSIAHENSGFAIPDRMVLDAYRIYVDEGYHALIAADLARHVATRAGSNAWARRPYFLLRLDEILAEAGPELAPLLEILFVVVSETLISGTLAQAASASGLSESVRAALGDHARDERRHQVYFSEFLRVIWPQLDASAQRDAGLRLPALIDAFLRPDFADASEELRDHGFSDADVEQIIEESYPKASVAEARRQFSCQTVRSFTEVGALADPHIREQFEAAGLLDPSLV
jgi:hypothetical protein